MNKRELKITEDGSHTLYVEALDETYHSTHGDIQESLHVFINAGLNYCSKSHLRVLEIGFGTGLNAFLTLLATKKQGVKINYTSLEAFPLENEIIEQLNYTNALRLDSKEKEQFTLLHKVEWESYQKITDWFNLKKIKKELLNYQAEEQFDLIYFDAFGPNVQPEMWIKNIFTEMYNCLSNGGVLVTYCAKGSVKRTLKEVGFNLEGLPGPPGKREMTRAIKKGDEL